MTNQTSVIRALRSRSALTAAAVLLGTAGLVGATAQPAAAVGCTSVVPHDVNGDGHAEVAVGEPGSKDASGAVHVFYGHRTGLVAKATGTARDDQYLSQNTPGVPGSREPFDYFGEQVALGDFNHDRCADLAITAPGENDNQGSVTVLYGSPSGITTSGAQRSPQPPWVSRSTVSGGAWRWRT